MALLKEIKNIGFKKHGNRYYHEALEKYECFLRYETYDIKGKGWYFIGSWEHLNKSPIKTKERLLNFVKYAFGVNLCVD